VSWFPGRFEQAGAASALPLHPPAAGAAGQQEPPAGSS
jgi:hypothetical protein